MEGEGGRVCHATDRPRSGDPLLHAGPGRLPHRGRPVDRPAARQARRKAPGGPPWLNSVTVWKLRLASSNAMELGLARRTAPGQTRNRTMNPLNSVPVQPVTGFPGVTLETNVRCRLRDGVELLADIYRPDPAGGPY